MRCARVKGLLSDYIDGLLDAERATLVENHLAKCGKCRKELESLRTLIHELRSLESVMAPDDFLASIHSRLEKETFWERIKAFLFIPARIRIPMEWATLAATVVIAFFVFHLVPFTPSEKSLQFQAAKKTKQEQPLVAYDSSQKIERSKSDEQPAGPTLTVAENQPMTSKGKLETKDSRQNEKIVGAIAMPVEAAKRERGSESVPRPAAKPVAPAPAAAMDAKKDETSLYSMPLKVQSLTEEEQSAFKKQETIVASIPESGVLRDELNGEPERIQLGLILASGKNQASKSVPPGSPAPSALEVPSKKIPQSSGVSPVSRDQIGTELAKSKSTSPGSKNLAALVFPNQIREEALLKIETTLSPLGGRILQVNRNKETQQPEFVDIEIPIQYYEKFIVELNTMGKLNMPAGKVGDPSPQTLRIKLQLMIQD